MMMSEFIDRTGFEPTAKEYAKIEEAYYDFDGDKDAFCKAFVKDGGARKLCKARAAEIDRLNSLLLESERQYKKDVADREKQIDELTAELDRELEWKPSDSTGTNMDQKSYEELAKYGKAMTDEEAKTFIADECGFAPEKIRILHEVNTYEVNKHRRSASPAPSTARPCTSPPIGTTSASTAPTSCMSWSTASFVSTAAKPSPAPEVTRAERKTP